MKIFIASKLVETFSVIIDPQWFLPFSHEFLYTLPIVFTFCGYQVICTGVLYVKFLLVVDFVIPNKGESLIEAYDKWQAWAEKKVCCDYGFHAAVTWWSDQVAQEMETLCREKGIKTIM